MGKREGNRIKCDCMIDMYDELFHITDEHQIVSDTRIKLLYDCLSKEKKDVGSYYIGLGEDVIGADQYIVTEDIKELDDSFNSFVYKVDFNDGIPVIELIKSVSSDMVKRFAFILKISIKEAKEIMELLNKLANEGKLVDRKVFETFDDYENEWLNHWFHFSSWEELMKSEEEMVESKLSEQECKQLINIQIFKLSTGMYIQYEP